MKPLPEEDLARLVARIREIEAIADAPFAPGEETRPIRPVSESFDENDWQVVTRVVRAVVREHRATLNSFLGEIGVAQAVVGAIARPLSFPPRPQERPAPTTIADLATRIDEDVVTGAWAVVVPISNTTQPESLVELDDSGFLTRADDSPEPGRWADTDDPRYELRRRLGELVDIRPRWLHTSLLTHPLDTRMGAALVLVVEGSESVVTQVAQAQAHYIVATWSLLSPPGFRQLWPIAGPWAPQPFELISTRRHPARRADDDPSWQRARTGSITQFGEYEVSDDVRLLQRPLRAVRAADNRRSARALLSATWAWYQAARDASGLEVTDTVFYAFTCMAALCEDPFTHREGQMFRRWDALQKNVPQLMERARTAGLDDVAIGAARQTLHDVRNLAAHGSDAVLINLGFPASRTRTFRRGEVAGIQLGLASLHAALRPSLWLLREALLYSWSRADAAGFSDDAFETLFAPSM